MIPWALCNLLHSTDLMSCHAIEHYLFQFFTGQQRILRLAEVHYTLFAKPIMALKRVMLFHHFPTMLLLVRPCRTGSLIIALNDFPTKLIHVRTPLSILHFTTYVHQIRSKQNSQVILSLYDNFQANTRRHFVAP